MLSSMTKYLLILLALVTISLKAGPSQDPKDVQFQKMAQDACDQLGDDCNIYLQECVASSSHPNICLVSVYFHIEVAREQCGDFIFMSCYDQNRLYTAKWMHELNLPNLSNPKRLEASESCENAGNYSVNSGELKSLEDKLVNAMNSVNDFVVEKPLYTDYQVYYQCFKTHLEK